MIEQQVSKVATPLNLGESVDRSADAANREQSLVKDLERLLRFASTAKGIEVPKEVLEEAAKTLQAANAQVGENRPLDPDTALSLFRSIDLLSPKVYPVTTASLEIGDIMEVGNSGGTEREQQIKRRVGNLILVWILAALVALIVVFFLSAIISDEDAKLPTGPHILPGLWPKLLPIANFVTPIVLGFLGACAYILRSILQGLANQTFVLRDGTSYMLRAILGMILGFMIPNLFLGKGDHLGLSAIAIPFLAGYAVEPMFAALDNVVLTLRDAVSRNPAPGGAKAR
ncbi:MAG: hypothetical protein ABSA49_07240 [Rhizomicrobium sp.]|jgi:hypothetical protein